MATPLLTLLSPDDQKRIHTDSLRVLEEVGVQILEPQALEILTGHGARVDRARQRVHFPPDLVTAAAASGFDARLVERVVGVLARQRVVVRLEGVAFHPDHF